GHHPEQPGACDDAGRCQSRPLAFDPNSLPYRAFRKTPRDRQGSPSVASHPFYLRSYLLRSLSAISRALRGLLASLSTTALSQMTPSIFIPMALYQSLEESRHSP